MLASLAIELQTGNPWAQNWGRSLPRLRVNRTDLTVQLTKTLGLNVAGAETEKHSWRGKT